MPNFGDCLSPWIISKITGKEVHYSEDANKLVGLGSILHHHEIQDGDTIWGTGFRCGLSDTVKAKNLEIQAVRGPLTRNRLLELGYECPEIYGDPAILMHMLYHPKIEKRYKTALLPHFLDYWLVSKHDGHILSVARPPLEVINGILAAERLITSSLHGVIIAEAYGIPVIWSCNSNTDRFKFEDYLASTGRKSIEDPRVPLDCNLLINALKAPEHE